MQKTDFNEIEYYFTLIRKIMNIEHPPLYIRLISPYYEFTDYFYLLITGNKETCKKQI